MQTYLVKCRNNVKSVIKDLVIGFSLKTLRTRALHYSEQQHKNKTTLHINSKQLN